MSETTDLVEINEIVLRDGLQNEPNFISTAEKIRLAGRLSGTGVQRIEVSAFVSSKAIPNLCDAAVVFQGIKRNPEVRYAVLAPNLRSAERTLECALDVSVALRAAQCR